MLDLINFYGTIIAAFQGEPLNDIGSLLSVLIGTVALFRMLKELYK